MNKLSKKKVGVGLLVIFILSLIVIYNYNTNYSWRYKDFLSELTDVENNEYIKKVKMYYNSRSPTATSVDIEVSEKDLSQEQVKQMIKDIADNFNKSLHNLELSLIFNVTQVVITIDVYGINGNGGYRVFAEIYTTVSTEPIEYTHEYYFYLSQNGNITKI